MVGGWVATSQVADIARLLKKDNCIERERGRSFLPASSSSLYVDSSKSWIKLCTSRFHHFKILNNSMPFQHSKFPKF